MNVIKQLLAHLRAFINLHARSCFLVLSAVSGLIIGTAGHDIIADDTIQDGLIYTKEGNDIVVITPSRYRDISKYYDAGKGIDSVWIRLKPYEYRHPHFNADLIRFYLHLLNDANPATQTGEGPVFHFHSIQLSVRNVENLVLEKLK